MSYFLFNSKSISIGALVLTTLLSTSASAEITFSSSVSSDLVQKKRSQYDIIKDKIENQRLAFQFRIGNAASEEEKNSIIVEAQDYLSKVMVSDIAPSWYGTPHDYNGASNKPGDGKIACGYFVSTVLNHLGFRFDRKLLGRQNSPYIIEAFSHPTLVKTTWLQDYNEFVADIKADGPGVYIVGMDRHVGFVAYDGDKLAFIHSYKTVQSQPINERSLLSISKWRMMGKTFGFALVAQWIRGETIDFRVDPTQ